MNDKIDISKIEIYANDQKLTTLTQAPYSYKTSSLKQSACTIKAIAQSTNNLKSTIEKNIFIGSLSTTEETSIKSNNDDIEESQDGSIIGMNDHNLEFGKSKFAANSNMGLQKVDLRFTNLNIRKGAIIKKAYIQFTASEPSSAD